MSEHTMASPKAITQCIKIENVDIKSSPLMCGVCEEKFAKLDVFLLHVSSHNSLYNKYLHVCDYNSESSHSNSEISIYRCRTCSEQFSSICLLHNHIVQKSGDGGSYIFDNTKNMAYPLSMKCSGDMLQELCEDDASMRAEGVEDKKLNKFTETEEDKGMFNQVEEFVKEFTRKAVGHSGKVNPSMEKSASVCKQGDKNEKTSLAQNLRISSLTPLQLNKLIGKGNVIVVREKVHVSKTKRRAGTSGSRTKNTRQSRWPNAQNDCDEEKSSNSFSLDDEATMSSDTEPNVDLVEPKVETAETMDNEFGENLVKEEIINLESEVNEPSTKQNQGFAKKMKVKKNKRKSGKVGPCGIPTKRKPPDPYPPPTDETECPHCCKRFMPCKMKIHLLSHTDERPLKCDKCPKTYKYRHNYQEHLASHREVKPFYCEICGQGMTTGYALKNHKLVHHSTSNPFVCGECGAAFKLKSRLKRHESSHTGIKSQQCELCGMKFARRYNLTVHVRSVHNKDKRFTCSKCDKHFLTNYQLKVHLMKHSGERPYKCSVCDAGYIEKKELKKHLKKNHNLSLEEGNYVKESLASTTTEDLYFKVRDHSDRVQMANVDEVSYSTCDMNRTEHNAMINDTLLP